jgi:PhnB protein
VSAAELAGLRYGVTDLLDDLRGATDPAEVAFVAVGLVDALGGLALVAGGGWSGTGKWLGRRLREHDPALHEDLVAGLRAAASGDGGPLAATAAGVLDRVGGPLLAGYRVAGEPGFPYEVAPELSVRRGVAAIDFYTAAFGAVELFRVGGDEAEPSVVAQLAVGGATFWVADEAPAYGHASPQRLGATSTRLLLVVPDPVEVVAQAVALGAEEINPVGEAYGFFLGMIRDPFGHLWEIGYPLHMP